MTALEHKLAISNARKKWKPSEHEVFPLRDLPPFRHSLLTKKGGYFIGALRNYLRGHKYTYRSSVSGPRQAFDRLSAAWRSARHIMHS